MGSQRWQKSLCGPLGVAAPPPSTTPPPALAWPRRIKFKGFKCKYFSFIDASCLQRARFLAAQLYCPISFPYLGTGEPGGWGRGSAPAAGRGWKLPPGDPGWGGWGGSPLSDSRLGRERQELGRGQLVAGVFFSYLKEIKAARPAHTGFLLVPVECPLPACFLAARRLPHSPGLGGAHKARQLELKIYAKQLLTDCKGVQLCAECSLEAGGRAGSAGAARG